MTRVIAGITTSVDGYVAGPDDAFVFVDGVEKTVELAKKAAGEKTCTSWAART